MSALKQTALYALHLELAAKMVVFSDYHMPLHYADGILKEHLHCRSQLGLFDVSHMGQISVTGSLSATRLETLTPGNITGLLVDQLRYCVFTNKKGGIIDDVIIARIHQDKFLITVNAACKDKVFTHLHKHLSATCQVDLLQNQALIALQGPAASMLMPQLSKAASKLGFMRCCSTEIDNTSCLISRCGYTGEDGFEISIDKQYAETLTRKLLTFNYIKPVGLAARDTLRLEAGLGLYGNEFDESINPVAANLTWTFRKNAKHFPGADFIHTQQKIATKKRLVGLVIDGKSVLRNKTILYDGNATEIGFVSSGSYSPSLKRAIALAYIEASYTKLALTAKVRHRNITANITDLPFVPHRYHSD